MEYKIYSTLHYEGQEFEIKEETFASESDALNTYIDMVTHNSQVYESYESWEENSTQKGMTHWFYCGEITLQIDYIPTVKRRAMRK